MSGRRNGRGGRPRRGRSTNRNHPPSRGTALNKTQGRAYTESELLRQVGLKLDSINIRAPSGVPMVRRISLKYAVELQKSLTASVVDFTRIRANGAWDPELQTTGHQPMGWDTWSALYRHYVVYNSWIRVTVSTCDKPLTMGIYLDDDATTTAYTTASSLIEAGRGTWRTVPGNIVSSHRVASIFNTVKFFNVHDVKDNIGRLGALTEGTSSTAIPDEEALFTFWLQSLDQCKCNIWVEIVYDLEFSEPMDIATS